MRLALALLVLLAAAPVLAARFVGDAEGMYVLAVAATADGGFVMVGSPPAPWGTPLDGLVIAIDAAGNTTWAAEVEGVQLRAVAALPDGGVLVGGGALLARLAPGGAVTWQQDWGSAFINAVACDGGSSCSVSGFETFLHSVTFIEPASGSVVTTLRGDAGIERMRFVRDGRLFIGGVLPRPNDELGAVFGALLRRDGAQEWALRSRFWGALDNWNAFTYVTCRAIDELPDGRVLLAGHDEWGNPTGLIVSLDGRPEASFTSDVTEGVAATADGSVMVSTSDGRLELFTGGQSIDAIEGLGSQRLARLTDGRMVGVGSGVTWMSSGLQPDGDCRGMRPSWQARGRPLLDVVAADLNLAPGLPVTSVAGSWTWRPACLTGCLASCEAACLDGLDDDGNGLTDCDDPGCAGEPACAGADSDGDGIPNSTDCAPADPGAWERPASANLTMKKGWGATPILVWAPLRTLPSDPESPPTDVVRGLLADLHASQSLAGAACIGSRVRGEQFYDYWARPGWSESVWYLVRHWNACGPGSWGSAELDARGGCP